jgi:hypothetical protein
MLWVRISDIVEEMRRKKIESDLQNSGWVSADMMGGNAGGIQPDLQFQPPPGSGNFGPGGVPGGPMRLPQGAPQPQTGPVVIDDWFSLEPVGRIRLTLSFSQFSHIYIIRSELTDDQPSTLETRHPLMSDSVERALFARVKKRSSNSMATSSCSNSSTTSCAAPSVASSSNTLPACNVRIATTLVTKSAIRRSLPSVSRNRTPKPILMRRSSTTVFLIVSRTSRIWALIGAAIVVISFRLVESRQRDATVRWLQNLHYHIC